MKKILTITFFSFFVLSCGKNTTGPKSIKSSLSTNIENAKQCGCTTDYRPVCSTYPSGKKQTFENECLANCFSTTFEHNIRCEEDQSDSQSVCYGSETLPETEAFKKGYGHSDRNYQILKYGSCTQYSM